MDIDKKAANEGSAISRMNKYRLKRSNIKQSQETDFKPYHPRPMPNFLEGFLLEKINR